jgi:RNase H-fold protein (predicted Holliday junction resolvase)
MILAIDPGREKCGIAVLDKKGKVLERGISPREEVKSSIYHLLAKHKILSLVIGRSAFGRELERELSRMDIKSNIVFVSEKFSTLEARKRYWKHHRPKGLLRLVPTSLLSPPVPVDDYAAVILGERYLKG